jgi:hypothetical protein
MAVFNTKEDGSSGTDASSYTFSTVPIGTAASNRWCIALVKWRRATPTTLTSVTIGGVTASLVKERNYDSGGGAGSTTGLSIWVANVPAGTTADLVVTLAATVLRCAYALATVNGINPTATDTAEATGADPLVASIDVAEDGVIAAVAANGNTATGAWSSLTEDVDANVEASSWYGVAYHDDAAAESNRAISCDLTGTITDHVMIAASFAPAAAASAARSFGAVIG